MEPENIGTWANSDFFPQISGPTERSQFFAHFSFTPNTEALTGLHMAGATLREQTGKISASKLRELLPRE